MNDTFKGHGAPRSYERRQATEYMMAATGGRPNGSLGFCTAHVAHPFGAGEESSAILPNGSGQVTIQR